MIFFGVGTGRCGTMTLANLLNAEENVVCLHEGKLRHGETSGDQWIPMLTLQNLRAYHHPNEAENLLTKTRSQLSSLLSEHKLTALGDIAYNYAPFVAVIPRLFPAAKLLVVCRDGRDFVRSAYALSKPDPAPVGWSDTAATTKVERFIELGRLRPSTSHPLHDTWSGLSPLEKNAWLWAETNRLILEGLDAWSESRTLVLRFEEFFSDPARHYETVRRFLGLGGPVPKAVLSILERPINARPVRVLAPWTEWDAKTQRGFDDFAGDMMQRLGYA